ncbi:MAG: PEGA domain-containing protein [Myxococcota bacterium]|nr:PEGA domain-containing protein [Myxococcota bacterium]
MSALNLHMHTNNWSWVQWGFIILMLIWPHAQASADKQTDLNASMEAAQKARADYRAGRYQEAASGYQKAYELYPQLTYLEKIAKAYDKDPALCSKAESAWRRFMEVCGECPKRTKALRRIDVLAQSCAGSDDLEVDAPKEALARYRAGLKLSQGNQWPAAVAAFQTALDLWPQSIKLRRALARAEEQSGEFLKAAQQYEAIITQDPDIKDKSALIALIGSLRKQAKARQGTVTIKTQPHGAAVFVNGAAKAHAQQTPVKIALPAGRHRLALSLDGYETEEAIVLVERDQEALVDKKLRPASQSASQDWIWWTVGGVGAAAIVAGVAFHVSAAQTADGISRTDRASFYDDVDSIQMSEGLAWSGYGVGAALVTTAIIMMTRSDASKTAAQSSAQGSILRWQF